MKHIVAIETTRTQYYLVEAPDEVAARGVVGAWITLNRPPTSLVSPAPDLQDKVSTPSIAGVQPAEGVR